MRYTITSQQINYLRKEQQIELEGLYTVEQAHALKQLLDSAQNSSGRDLHRENPPLISALYLSKLGQVASQLYGKKTLRLAFTQYTPFPLSTLPIKEISSFSQTCGGCLLDLETGTIFFYTADFPLDFPHIRKPSLFIAFSTNKARYTLQENDPHTHLLKKFGYAFGDLISDATHPLICK